MNAQYYYSGYEQEDDEDSEKSNSDSSGDEVEKDVLSFFKSKNFKTSLNKSELADEFEAEMNQQLDSLIDIEKNKYFPESTEIIPAVVNSSQINKISSEKMKNEEDINYLIEDTDSEEEMATGERRKKKKPQFTNDDLLYDPDMDDQDEKWMNKHRETSKKKLHSNMPVSSFTSKLPVPSANLPEILIPNKSDAVLNCPCCMSLLTMDCQRHENFKSQYRAMFVFNCIINMEEQLKYPKNEDDKKKLKKFKKKTESKMDEEKSCFQESVVTENDFDVYRSVTCKSCNTSVGVYDEKDEIYHFFNVLAGHS